MTTTDKKRFANALKNIVSDLDRTAKSFCYRNDSDYQEVRDFLIEKIKQLQKEAEEYEGDIRRC